MGAACSPSMLSFPWILEPHSLSKRLPMMSKLSSMPWFPLMSRWHLQECLQEIKVKSDRTAVWWTAANVEFSNSCCDLSRTLGTIPCGWVPVLLQLIQILILIPWLIPFKHNPLSKTQCMEESSSNFFSFFWGTSRSVLDMDTTCEEAAGNRALNVYHYCWN